MAVDAQLLAQPPAGERDHRAQPQRLGDDGAQVGVVVASSAAGARARAGGGAGGRTSTPGRSRSSRGRRAAASSAGRGSRRRPSARRPRSARRRAARGCPRAGRRGARRSRRRAARRSPAAAPAGARADPGPPKRRESSTPNCSPADDVPRQQPPEPLGQPRAARRVGDAEDRAQDHLERDRLHARVQRERLAARPASSTSRATTSRTVASYARMRSPWNGGSISLRRARCSRPSSSSSEREPTIGCSASVRPGGSVCRARCRARGSPRGRRASPSASGSRGS